jgi:hypothetical protein
MMNSNDSNRFRLFISCIVGGAAVVCFFAPLRSAEPQLLQFSYWSGELPEDSWSVLLSAHVCCRRHGKGRHMERGTPELDCAAKAPAGVTHWSGAAFAG